MRFLERDLVWGSTNPFSSKTKLQTLSRRVYRHIEWAFCFTSELIFFLAIVVLLNICIDILMMPMNEVQNWEGNVFEGFARLDNCFSQQF